jgi:hypothetical protein
MNKQSSAVSGRELERYWERHYAQIEFHELFNEREIIDERAIAIVGAAFLDTMLSDILAAFMVDDEKEVQKLLGYDHAMGTFSSRITAAYCLGFICKTVRDDLRIVGKIRNKFAHEMRASFDSDPIRGWCHDLKWHEFGMMMKAPTDATSRDIFQVGVNQLICYLNGRATMTLWERRVISKVD